MTKIAIKSDKITPFGGIFWIMQQFERSLSQVIDSTLGVKCKFYGYQYSEILRSLMCIYFCGGSCVEDRPQLTPYKPPFASPKAPHLQR